MCVLTIVRLPRSYPRNTKRHQRDSVVHNVLRRATIRGYRDRAIKILKYSIS